MAYLIKRILFWVRGDRIGPEMPISNFLSYFPRWFRTYCKRKFLSFGNGAEIRPGATIVYCSTISIGNNVIVRPGSMIQGDSIKEPIIIEDDVLLGPGIHIYSINHRYERKDIIIAEQGYKRKKVIIRKGAWLGANVIVLPGVIVGEHAVVGAGSVVTKDIPAFTLSVGNPAKVIKNFNSKTLPDRNN